jgi:hypothetical protein
LRRTLIVTLTSDIIWSALAVLLTVVAVRLLLQHR